MSALHIGFDDNASLVFKVWSYRIEGKYGSAQVRQLNMFGFLITMQQIKEKHLVTIYLWLYKKNLFRKE